MFRSPRERLDAAMVAAAALLTNFLYFAFTARDYLFPDSLTYLAPARGLLYGLGFVTEAGMAETLRTPGYPLLLAAFGTRIVPVIVAQHVMNAMVAVAIYLFAARLLGRFIGMTAALLYAIDTPAISCANKILSEPFFTLVLMAVFILVASRRALPAAGLLTGALVLIRPVAIGYFAVVAVFLLLRKARMRDVVVYVLLALALPCAWAMRNRIRTGVFTVSSIGATHMLADHAAGALAILDEGDDFEADRVAETEGLTEDADDEMQRTLHVADAGDLPHAVRAKYYSRMAWRVIRQHPVAFAEATLRGLLVTIFESRWDAMSGVSRLHPSIVHIALDVLTVAMFVFAVIGALALRRDDVIMLAIITVAYYLLMASSGGSESRYRVPVMPQYAMIAAAGVAVASRSARQRDQPDV